MYYLVHFYNLISDYKQECSFPVSLNGEETIFGGISIVWQIKIDFSLFLILITIHNLLKQKLYVYLSFIQIKIEKYCHIYPMHLCNNKLVSQNTNINSLAKLSLPSSWTR